MRGAIYLGRVDEPEGEAPHAIFDGDRIVAASFPGARRLSAPAGCSLEGSRELAFIVEHDGSRQVALRPRRAIGVTTEHPIALAMATHGGQVILAVVASDGLLGGQRWLELFVASESSDPLVFARRAADVLRATTLTEAGSESLESVGISVHNDTYRFHYGTRWGTTGGLRLLTSDELRSYRDLGSVLDPDGAALQVGYPSARTLLDGREQVFFMAFDGLGWDLRSARRPSIGF